MRKTRGRGVFRRGGARARLRRGTGAATHRAMAVADARWGATPEEGGARGKLRGRGAGASEPARAHTRG